MALETKPLDFGERLGAAFKLYQANFVTFVTITAVIVVPLQLVSVLLGAWLSRDLPVDPETGLVDVEAIDGSTALAYAATFFVAIVITAIGSLLATGGVTKAAADDAVGRSRDWQDSLRYAMGRLGALIAGSLLFGLGVAGVVVGGILATVVLVALTGALGALIGSVATIAGAVFLAVSWSIWVPPVIVERTGAIAALSRSAELVSGRRWPIMGYLLVVGLLVGLINGIAGGVIGGFAGSAGEGAGFLLETVVRIALSVVTAPIYAAALIVLYFDQRVRSEGVDPIIADLTAADDDPFGSLPPGQTPPV